MIDYTKVKQIYMGRDKICRCGCAGEYVEPGDPKFDKRLKRFQKMVAEYVPGPHDVDETYFNISYGRDRALTVYFD
jgi:hypothetical protein